MRILLALLALLCLTQTSAAQHYAWYPSYYGGGYYRAPFYGGGLGPSCGYYGCNAHHSYYAPPRAAMRSGFGDYRQYYYTAHRYHYRTRHPQDAGGEFGVGW